MFQLSGFPGMVSVLILCELEFHVNILNCIPCKLPRYLSIDPIYHLFSYIHEPRLLPV